jgi:hypothetical protein
MTDASDGPYRSVMYFTHPEFHDELLKMDKDYFFYLFARAIREELSDLVGFAQLTKLMAEDHLLFGTSLTLHKYCDLIIERYENVSEVTNFITGHQEHLLNLLQNADQPSTDQDSNE